MTKRSNCYFEAAGKNATELLDHSSRDVTRAYLDPRIAKPKQASEMLLWALRMWHVARTRR